MMPGNMSSLSRDSMRKLEADTVVHPVADGWPKQSERLRPLSVAFSDTLVDRLDTLVEREACEADSRSEAVRVACWAWIERQEAALISDGHSGRELDQS